jgi:hypothetical protein
MRFGPKEPTASELVVAEAVCGMFADVEEHTVFRTELGVFKPDLLINEGHAVEVKEVRLIPPSLTSNAIISNAVRARSVGLKFHVLLLEPFVPDDGGDTSRLRLEYERSRATLIKMLENLKEMGLLESWVIADPFADDFARKLYELIP